MPTSDTLVYLAFRIHRRGGMERAAYEVLHRLKRNRQIIVIAKECEDSEIAFFRVRAFDRPALISVIWYRWIAKRTLRQLCQHRSLSGITSGIGASGGAVDVVIAQYCQEAYRQKVGVVRGRRIIDRFYHRWTLASFCADERSVYQSPRLKRVIAVSRGVGRELVEYYGIDPSIIRYVPNGVDLNVFKPLDDVKDRSEIRRELQLPIDGFLACFVGGDWRRKGLRAAIEALGNLPEVHLIVVGEGNRAEFAEYAAAVNAMDRVHFVGKRSDPHRFMQASDVYVFPSLYEAFSLSCIEAAACGLPLLVTKINGAEELVEDGENGFFIEHEANSIASRLRELRDNPVTRNRLAARAAKDALKYNWDDIAAAHAEVYDELDAHPSD